MENDANRHKANCLERQHQHGSEANEAGSVIDVQAALCNLCRFSQVEGYTISLEMHW